MLELTFKQIENITEIVSNSEITYSHLPDDLIDHICCDVVSEMSVGLSFKKALERVQNKFGDPGLQKIQEDTILLIDKKYRFMKTTMKIFGNVSLALVGIATIFKLFHWAGAGILLVIGFALLSFVFYPATLIASFRKNGRKNALQYIFASIGGITLILGILFKIQHWQGASILLGIGWVTILILFLPLWLITYLIQNKGKESVSVYIFGVLGVIIFELSTFFKIQHWPGAGVMLIVGAILIVSVFLPLYAKKLYRKSDYSSGRFIYLIIIISFSLIFGSLINLNLSRKVFKGLFFTDLYAQTERDYYQNANLKILNNLHLTGNNDESNLLLIEQKADSLVQSVKNMKKKLIVSAEKIENSKVDKYLKNIELVRDKTQNSAVEHFLFGANNNAFAHNLKKGISEYKQLLIKNSNDNMEIKKELDVLFDLTDINSYGYYKSWEYRNFKHSFLFATLIQLSNIERNIRMAENLIFDYVKMENSLKRELTSNK